MIKNSGLRIPTYDPRDLSHKKHFGAFDISLLPKDFEGVEPLKIKNQLFSDECTAFSSTSVSESQEGVELSPDYTFAKTKQIEGDYKSFGGDPRDVCKAHIKFGALEQKDAPFTLEKDGRDFVANWKNWPEDLDRLASVHKKGAFFKCDSGKDLFDSIRIALFTNKNEKRDVFTGCYWQPEWTYAGGGIVPKISGNSEDSPHAIKAFGWKEINGEPYLKVQNSYGLGVGQNGIFYFPREVVNKFMFAYTFSDFDPEAIKAMQWKLLALMYDLLILLKRALAESVGGLFRDWQNGRDKHTIK